jgi:hypothetical protein
VAGKMERLQQWNDLNINDFLKAFGNANNFQNISCQIEYTMKINIKIKSILSHT